MYEYHQNQEDWLALTKHKEKFIQIEKQEGHFSDKFFVDKKN